MKKQLLLLVMILLPMVVSADDSGSCGENVTYTFNETTKTLTISGNGKMDWFRIENGWGNNDKDTPWKPYQEEILHVVIESNVTSIGEGSFWGCSNLKTVTIPSTVVECRNSSFKDCNNLEAVYITSLEAWCNIDFEMNGVSSNPLYYAHNLYLNGEKIVNLVVPEGISEIKTCTFCGFNEMTSLIIPNSVETIGPSAFAHCNGLSSLTVPNSVTEIKAYAFENCEGLTSIQLFDNLEKIGSFAFGYCTALFSIVIPNSVTTLGDSSFAGCSGLSYVTLSNSLKSVGGFSDCTSLTIIDIPEGVETIYGGAFMRCTNLTSIKMPSTIKTVDMNAFSNCYKLKQIHIADIGKWCQISYSSWSDASLPFAASYGGHLYLNNEEIIDLEIPDGVTSISANAFRYCIGINSVKMPQSVNKIGEQAFANCSNLEDVEISDNLQKLENKTFYGCKIKKVTIPSSVQYIYSQVFDACYSLESVRVKAETPPFLNPTAFSNYNIPLYVPAESVDAYKAAEPWKNFGVIQEIVEGYVKGDVDGDGEVNEVDAQQILDVSVGILSVNDLAVPEAINVPGGNPSALEVNAQLVLDYSVATVKPW